MASSEHLNLSDFIKLTHQKLRKEAKVLGPDTAWQQHCADVEHLEKYAISMQQLAQNHWEDNYKTNSKAISRNDWIYEVCKEYFYTDGIIKYRTREEEIAEKINILVDKSLLNSIPVKLKLLDVGSCYNPFKDFKDLDVTAIDIAPANESVLKCDFLNINIGDDNIISDNVVVQLSKTSFDVVVFSLLLEYLPSPKQRLLCCKNASNLLNVEGLLVIITPDSKHVGINAKYMKSWRFVLAELGFSRIKYEKLPYIHCMAFRKSLKKEVAQRWAELHKDKQVFDEIFIPQDFQDSGNSCDKEEKISCE